LELVVAGMLSTLISLVVVFSISAARLAADADLQAGRYARGRDTEP
jgi:hypothetical protein